MNQNFVDELRRQKEAEAAQLQGDLLEKAGHEKQRLETVARTLENQL